MNQQTELFKQCAASYQSLLADEKNGFVWQSFAELSKQEKVELLVNQHFEMALNDQHVGFSWEMFWKFDVIMKISDFNTRMLFNAIAVEKQKAPFDVSQLIDTQDAEVLNTVKACKKKLFKKHGIKRVTFTEYRDRIVTFLKDKRNIDFDLLDQAGVKKVFFEEDVMSHKEPIYDALGITHMQFKYLYQKGAVYK